MGHAQDTAAHFRREKRAATEKFIPAKRAATEKFIRANPHLTGN